ncbi:hypothetical protein STEG23_034769, partial [Scotinomys teguina]
VEEFYRRAHFDWAPNPAFPLVVVFCVGLVWQGLLEVAASLPQSSSIQES